MSWQGLGCVMAVKLAGPWRIWQSAKVEIFMAAPLFRVLLCGVKESQESANDWLKLSAPAKVNLMLSVHGRRADGFHDLTSLVVPLKFGDELALKINGSRSDALVGDGEAVPLDESNLVLQAARLFRRESGRSETFDFRLNKRIPVGAGLGGGSSDAVAALKGMDALLGTGMSPVKLRELAAALGSDCPFFVDPAPALMRGRGEQVEPVAPTIASRLVGRRLVLFRPDFAINTAWAYGQLALLPELYESEASAGARLRAFEAGGGFDGLLHNVFEEIVGKKFMAIPCLLDIFRDNGYNCVMSGSGSACFALVENSGQAAEMHRSCLNCWGESTF